MEPWLRHFVRRIPVGAAASPSPARASGARPTASPGGACARRASARTRRARVSRGPRPPLPPWSPRSAMPSASRFLHLGWSARTPLAGQIDGRSAPTRTEAAGQTFAPRPLAPSGLRRRAGPAGRTRRRGGATRSRAQAASLGRRRISRRSIAARAVAERRSRRERWRLLRRRRRRRSVCAIATLAGHVDFQALAVTSAAL
mmetsp:Transcript_131936/g.341479  ORF Transcript_131936/g.341479 Transcript_131936/m.341479 type:complete len:201 (+) Transcript_131936:881-1483(+)